jgi:hypothetical protein
MAAGPGKYDDICTVAREMAKADGAIVIIIDGERGSGFSVQLREGYMPPETLAGMLEAVASMIRNDEAKQGGKVDG